MSSSIPKSPGFGPKGFTGCVGSGGNTGPFSKTYSTTYSMHIPAVYSDALVSTNSSTSSSER